MKKMPSLAISQYHWTICTNHKSFGWYNLWKKNHLSFKCGTIIQWSLRMTHTVGFKIWQVPSLAKWTKIKISQYHWTICINHKSFGWYNLWNKNHLSFKCGTIIQWSLRMTHNYASRSGKLVPSLAKWTKLRFHNITEP